MTSCDLYPCVFQGCCDEELGYNPPREVGLAEYRLNRLNLTSIYERLKLAGKMEQCKVRLETHLDGASCCQTYAGQGTLVYSCSHAMRVMSHNTPSSMVDTIYSGPY